MTRLTMTWQRRRRCAGSGFEAGYAPLPVAAAAREPAAGRVASTCCSKFAHASRNAISLASYSLRLEPAAPGWGADASRCGDTMRGDVGLGPIAGRAGSRAVPSMRAWALIDRAVRLELLRTGCETTPLAGAATRRTVVRTLVSPGKTPLRGVSALAGLRSSLCGPGVEARATDGAGTVITREVAGGSTDVKGHAAVEGASGTTVGRKEASTEPFVGGVAARWRVALMTVVTGTPCPTRRQGIGGVTVCMVEKDTICNVAGTGRREAAGGVGGGVAMPRAHLAVTRPPAVPPKGELAVVADTGEGGTGRNAEAAARAKLPPPSAQAS